MVLPIWLMPRATDITTAAQITASYIWRKESIPTDTWRKVSGGNNG